MKTHYMKLLAGPFEKISLGKKDIEVRLLDKKRKTIEKNDEIIFRKLPELKEELKTKVVNLHKFSSFKELFDKFPIQRFGEEISKENLLKKVYKIYSQEKEQEFGVLGVEIMLS
jgi:ASC-1-like (ASCH) protein